MAEDKPETPPYVAWKTFLSATDQLQGSLLPGSTEASFRHEMVRQKAGC